MIKAMLVLESTGNFLSNDPKTSTFCPIMPEKNQFKDSYPLKKGKKNTKMFAF